MLHELLLLCILGANCRATPGDRRNAEAMPVMLQDRYSKELYIAKVADFIVQDQRVVGGVGCKPRRAYADRRSLQAEQS